jgi:hypothetical protein
MDLTSTTLTKKHARLVVEIAKLNQVAANEENEEKYKEMRMKRVQEGIESSAKMIVNVSRKGRCVCSPKIPFVASPFAPASTQMSDFQVDKAKVVDHFRKQGFAVVHGSEREWDEIEIDWCKP